MSQEAGATTDEWNEVGNERMVQEMDRTPFMVGHFERIQFLLRDGGYVQIKGHGLVGVGVRGFRELRGCKANTARRWLGPSLGSSQGGRKDAGA